MYPLSVSGFVLVHVNQFQATVLQ